MAPAFTASTITNSYWNTATPAIATADDYTGDFDGNGDAISNLFINRPSTDDMGLFASIGSRGKVQLLALKEVRIAGQNAGGGDEAGGRDNVGGLAGENAGTISETYVTGRVFGRDNVGGDDLLGSPYQSRSQSDH